MSKPTSEVSEQNIDRGLLEAFVMDHPDFPRLEALLGQFNIFEALGAVRQELRHSDFLAFLLDPSQNHGLGDEFARRLLQKALISAAGQPLPITAIDLDIWHLNDLVVRREWQGIDILLLDEAHQIAVIIENKVGTSEHSNQLERYFSVVRKHYPTWNTIGLYLTPEGDSPSHEAYIAVDYTTVCELVERITQSRSSTLGVDVCTMMSHYTQMIRRYIVTESEIADLCRRIYKKHERALDLIYEYRPDQQAAVKELMESIIRETPGLLLDDCSKSYIRFAPQEWDVPTLKSGTGWTRTGRILLFEFDNSPNRLNLKLVLGPGPDNIRQELFKMAHSHGPLFKPAFKALGQKWNTIYGRSFLTAKDYEEKNDEEMGKEIRKHWTTFMENDLPQIIAVVNEEKWIS